MPSAVLFVNGEAPAKAVAGTGATEKVRHVVTENISRDECTITWTVNLHTFQAVRQVCVVPQ